jgi:hypothetical protein
LRNEQIAQNQAFVDKLANADLFSGTVLLAKDGVPVFKAAYGSPTRFQPSRIDTSSIWDR